MLLKGDLGSCHTAMEVGAFRGLALADEFAPFVVINDNDSRAAWSFPLLHELTHLLLGDSGCAGDGPGAERFCAAVASELLLPETLVSELWASHAGGGAVDRIDVIARERNLSRTMIAWRLFRAGRIDRETFQRLSAEYRTQRRRRRAQAREEAREADGSPTWRVIRRHRLGPRLLGFTRRMMEAGALSTTRSSGRRNSGIGWKRAHGRATCGFPSRCTRKRSPAGLTISPGGSGQSVAFRSWTKPWSPVWFCGL